LDEDFIKNYHDDLFCMPVLIDIRNYCSTKDTTGEAFQYLKSNKITFDTLRTENGKRFLRTAAFFSLRDNIENIRKGFNNSLNFKEKETMLNKVILLDPCLVSRQKITPSEREVLKCKQILSPVRLQKPYRFTT
jgi:hypothetical protein